MKTPYTFYPTTIVFVASALASCDPGHFGKTFIRNESSYVLELKYTTNLFRVLRVSVIFF